MAGAVAQLARGLRRAKRPRWSQQFLAEELTRHGHAATRNQIARLEISESNRHPPELVAAIAVLLDADLNDLVKAIARDYLTVHRRVREGMGWKQRRVEREVVQLSVSRAPATTSRTAGYRSRP